MNEFLTQLATKFLSYVIFIIVAACFISYMTTGEFPPRISSIRKQYRSFAELKENYSVVLKKSAERLHQQDADEPADYQKTTHSQVAPVASDVEQLVKNMRLDQLKMQSQLERIAQQNQEILRRMNERR